MIIHLKKNEKLFINGAVIMLDRRGSIELLNDAQFLLASHVMQVEDATTPLRRLYFVVQTMIIDPAGAELTRTLFDTHHAQLCAAVSLQAYQELLAQVKKLVKETEYFEALKLLRKNFDMDEVLMAKMAGQTAAQSQTKAA
ncbi:flagellar biosynthesis repressor FlbT [Aestuariivirga sp.]|uniref:flagellar biosynthesis repressor FlbT n=1 Tax=Aestuariivirga sp. TaxID=2650926 RepID=UPI0039E71BBD